jgi:hypothetical protein
VKLWFHVVEQFTDMKSELHRNNLYIQATF